jgi:hypothetical protein
VNEKVGDPLSVQIALMLRSAGVQDPIVEDWVLHSKCDEAQAWRDFLKALAVYEQEAAIKRQRELRAAAIEQEKLKKPGQIRRIAVVDPVIEADFTARYGPGHWNDPDWVADTRRKAPELFVDKP